MVRKLKIISKIMTSQPEKQTITIQLIPNISISKGNQTTKLGPNFIVWLEKLGNMCIVIICFRVCNVKNLEVNLSFLIYKAFLSL